MSAVICPVSPIDVQVSIDPDRAVLYLVKCEKCLWYPTIEDGPALEADARIQAFEHNANRHPSASVHIETIGESYARRTRMLRKQTKTCAALAVLGFIVQLALLFAFDAPASAAVAIAVWTVIISTQSFWYGRWSTRLLEHWSHPPGTVMVSPGDGAMPE